MDKISLENIKAVEIAPGFDARCIHSESMTIVYWDIKKGSLLPQHHHEHEQIVSVLSGEFELVVDGRPELLRAGDVFVLHSNVQHSGRAITDCRIIDAFHPVREDYVFN